MDYNTIMDHDQLLFDLANAVSVKLLRTTHAPLILSFLYREFKQSGRVTIPHSTLAETLDEYLGAVGQDRPERYPSAVATYLRQWCDEEHRFLRRYHQSAVRQHFAAIGLALRFDEAKGYAYLVQPDPMQEEEWEGEEAPPAQPRLVRRTRLTYDATLLCVLLREELQNFDACEPDLDRLVLTKTQIRNLIRQFYPERADLTRLEAKIDRVISQVVAVGFLRRLSEQAEESYEVKRIIKAKLSADKLVEIRDQLVEYGEGEKQEE